MIDAQYDVLLEAIRKVERRLDDLEKVVNDIKKDLGDDRVKIDDVIIAQGRLNSTVEAMRGDTNNLSKKTQAVVKNAVETAVEPMQNTLDTFVEQKTKIIRQHIPTNFFLSIINKLRRK